MSKCNQYDINSLLAYLQHKLSEEENSQLQFHLLKCESCRETLNRIREFGDGCTEDLMKKIDDPDDNNGENGNTSHPKIKHMNFWQAAASIAVLVVLTIGGHYFFRPPEGTIPTINNGGIINANDSVIKSDKDSLLISPDTIKINRDSVFPIDTIISGEN